MGNHLSRATSATTPISRLIDQAVEKGSAMPGNELASRLGVSESYVTKLRGGFRPSRMGRETLRQVQIFVAGEVDPVAARLGRDSALFAAGVLWSIERQAREIAATAAAARATLESGGPGAQRSPTAGEIEVGLKALRTATTKGARERDRPA